ncbi:MAG: amidohydrolase family protein, partial [Armatimonadota bacterium]|nr:amidohydrolase family protein [Armatimonadota bacterium]
MKRHPERLVLAAGRVITPRGDLTPAVVTVVGERIVTVRQGRARRADLSAPEGILAPGLIDLQVNGASGVDFLSVGTGTRLEGVCRYLLSTGVTAFLPTLITTRPPRLRAALAWWRRTAAELQAPRVLGLHLEGPFLHPAFRGAHDPRLLRPPDGGLVRLLDEAPGLVRMVTLAPELPGADRLIEELRRRGCVISAGHTAAAYEQAMLAFARGVHVVTHLFNAMRGLHHREPGLAAAALDHPRVTVGLIADLVHVHPAMVRLAVRLKGWRRVALVTDAIAAAG